MRLVSVDRLAPGAVLARDVRVGTPGSAPLLRAGAAVTEGLREALARRGVAAVWIDDGISGDVEPLPPLPPETRHAAEQAVVATLDRARTRLRDGQGLASEDVTELAVVADAIAAQLVDAPEAVYALDELGSADQYTHEHSVRVCTLGVLLASRHWREHGWTDFRGRTRFDGIERLLSHLGLGLLVHDIGKLAIAAEIRDKPGALTPEEWEEMRRHPTLGREMLEGTHMPFVALGVVEGHHERWDGRGYPRGLAGRQIQDFACLAAIADVYDAVCSARPYKPARPPHEGVRVVREGAGTAFNPRMVETFLQIVMPYPVGHEVRLPDGADGVVVAVDAGSPYEPVVRWRRAGRVVEERVDLRERAPAELADPAEPAGGRDAPRRPGSREDASATLPGGAPADLHEGTAAA